MVGSLTTVAPSTFTDVQSGQANMAGDGKGGTKLSFTMTLFPPLGSDTAEFGYTATITDGVVPRASISALPVNPLESPTFKTAADSYQGGADTGVQLTDGASQIDANLLKLRDGAGELLAGLIKLRDGATSSRPVSPASAAPGARPARRRCGRAQRRPRQDRRRRGQAGGRDRRSSTAAATKLRDGAGSSSAGAGKLDDGAGSSPTALARLSSAARARPRCDGLAVQLEPAVDAAELGVDRQLATNARYQPLLGGLAELVAGVGARPP